MRAPLIMKLIVPQVQASERLVIDLVSRQNTTNAGACSTTSRATSHYKPDYKVPRAMPHSCAARMAAAARAAANAMSI